MQLFAICECFSQIIMLPLWKGDALTHKHPLPRYIHTHSSPPPLAHTPSATTAEPAPRAAHAVPELPRQEPALPPSPRQLSSSTSPQPLSLSLPLPLPHEHGVSQRPAAATHSLPVTPGTKYTIHQHPPEPHWATRFLTSSFWFGSRYLKTSSLYVCVCPWKNQSQGATAIAHTLKNEDNLHANVPSIDM